MLTIHNQPEGPIEGFQEVGPGRYRPTSLSDLSLLPGMQGLTVGGEFTFPSGAMLPDPKPGMVWKVEGEEIFLSEKKESIR